MKDDMRPEEYLYWRSLMNHLGNDTSKLASGELLYPRQLEIHLPGNGKVPCGLNCPHCAGDLFDKTLGNWEQGGLKLLDKLEGKIPFQVYGGAYTEPLLNSYFMDFMRMTKKYGNHFGIHTNGVELKRMWKRGDLHELNELSTDKVDYLSTSLDAGTPDSWCKTKGVKNEQLFYDILESIIDICSIRRGDKSHAVRLCYLISPTSGNTTDFKAIIDFAKEAGVDSLRFSIPFGNYNQDFGEIRKYKEEVEIPGDIKYREMLTPLVSKSETETPYIFYTGPKFTDIDDFDFDKCVYTAFQITLGANGKVAMCSTTATNSAPQCSLGKVTADLDKFNEMLIKSNNDYWDCQKNCFSKGLRCNRMGMEINRAYSSLEL